MENESQISIKAVLPLLGNFLKWMIPGVFVMIYCLVLLPIFSNGANSQGNDSEGKFLSRLPVGMLSFLGVSCVLIALSMLLLIVLNLDMDISSIITFATIGCLGVIFGFSWTRKELIRISLKNKV